MFLFALPLSFLDAIYKGALRNVREVEQFYFLINFDRDVKIFFFEKLLNFPIFCNKTLLKFKFSANKIVSITAIPDKEL
jgi:hypothetical protein